MYGLVRRGNEALVPYAIRMMTAINALRESGRAGSNENTALLHEYFDTAAQFKAHFCRDTCKPHFVGVWDTVSSVGWIENPVRLPFTSDNPDIQIGRHAIAIDERRAFFRTNLWRPRPPAGGPKDLKQVWFPGVHCDVGGGYPEAESGLAKIALEWMLKEAKQAGLMVEPAKEDLVLGKSGGSFVRPDFKGPMHESLKSLWRLAEFVPKRHYDWERQEERRRMNLFRRRYIPPQSLIHQAAYEQGEEYRRRLPPDGIPVT
jgi:uncharacterized protein (DUF2235 family)